MNIHPRSFFAKRKFERILVRGMKKKYKELHSTQKLNKEQIQRIQEFYKKLCGHEVPTIWHEYMYARTGEFDVRIIPSSLYRIELIGRMNNWERMMGSFSDKNLSDILLANIKQPKIILKNINGYYYSEGKAISIDEAEKVCRNLRNVIIKPSLGEGGTGVQSLNVKDGMTDLNGKSLKDVFKQYKKDFLIQEKVVQHKDMNLLNPTSVNTIRVLTYRMEMEILVLYAVVRIGKAGMVIDNESKGGISAKINEDGTLAKYAYGAPGNDKVQFTDSGVKLDGFKIPSFEKVIESAKQSHYQLPFFDIVGWDFCIDEDGEPVMIEWNTNPDLSQSANGPAFGKYTELIVPNIYKKENTREKNW